MRLVSSLASALFSDASNAVALSICFLRYLLHAFVHISALWAFVWELVPVSLHWFMLGPVVLHVSFVWFVSLCLLRISSISCFLHLFALHHSVSILEFHSRHLALRPRQWLMLATMVRGQLEEYLITLVINDYWTLRISVESKSTHSWGQ